jgi:hypothetical protein
MATAVSAGAESGQVGNREAMESWDLYRGGLEVLASYARQFNPGAFPDAAAVGNSILAFTCERMTVAARLQAHARNWAGAYELLRRLHAYDFTPHIGFDHDDVARFAAIETAFVECAQLGASEIVVGDTVPDHILAQMNPIDGARLIRPGEVGPGDLRRAYCVLEAEPDASMRPQDFSCDILKVMERFPIFSPQA